MTFLGRLHRGLIVGRPSWAYAALACVGALPILCAYGLGYGADRALPADTLLACIEAGRVNVGDSVVMNGFLSRPNWIAYPVMLPLALLLVRSVLRMMYGETPRSPLAHNCAYASVRARVQSLVADGRTILAALVATLGVTAVDKYWDVFQFTADARTCPHDLDWGWFATVYSDLHWPSAVVMHVVTTIEQFLIIGLAIVLLVNLARFNGAYLDSIHIRSRSPDGFQLDLDDPDRRMGLGRLSSVFNMQLLVVGCVGILLLVSRYANVDSRGVNDLIDTVTALVDDFPNTYGYAERLWAQVGALYPDAGQVVGLAIWAMLVWSAMRAANVKLLPLAHVRARDGRVRFLREIVAEGSAYDALLASGGRHDVDAVAEAFRGHDFWPSGDTRAAENLFFCTFVMLLLLFPVVPASAREITALGLFVVASFLISRAYLEFHEYRLRRVDRSLVQN